MTSPNRTSARTSRIAATLVAGASLLLGACAANGEAERATIVLSETSDSDTSPTDESPATELVVIARSRFETPELRIAAGTTVVWRNEDGFAHTVTSRDDSPTAFDSGEFSGGETFEITFDEPGEYAYFCRIHPTMRAMVIVE